MVNALGRGKLLTVKTVTEQSLLREVERRTLNACKSARRNKTVVNLGEHMCVELKRVRVNITRSVTAEIEI